MWAKKDLNRCDCTEPHPKILRSFPLHAVLTLLAVGCWRSPPPVPFRPVAVSAPGLDNAFRLGERIYSGSSPEGDAGFESLRKLGVRTIITVDGAAPDLERARQYGMRYVHLPVGYDGIPRDRALSLARAVRDLPGPIYIHCHHGKHRGPAAVACALLATDPNFSAKEGSIWLQTAGTDPRYRGLVELPDRFVPPTRAELAQAETNFPEVAPTANLTRKMVTIDELADALKAEREAGWKSAQKSANRAVLLAEEFRESARLPEVTQHPEMAMQMLAAEAATLKLESALRQGDLQSRKQAFSAVTASCSRCHAKFRDVRDGLQR